MWRFSSALRLSLFVAEAGADGAGVLPLWRGKPLVTGEDEALTLAWLPHHHEALGDANDPPVFLGLDDGRPVWAADISRWEPEDVDLASLGLFLSNTASAVLVAPIAIMAAEALGVSPYPFAIAVLIAASAAFITPFSTPVVTLVVEPGRYSFVDFVKVGIPLLLLTWLTTLVVTPLFFPYGS